MSTTTTSSDMDSQAVRSDCGSDQIGLGTAVQLYTALGRWIADQRGTDPAVEAKSALVGSLLAHAVTPVERGAIARTALRAGLLWRCHPCKQDHLLTTEACGCGAPRPAHLG